MPFLLKFFYIVQIAYWFHGYPELYFSKVKREEMPSKIKFCTINLVYVAVAYSLKYVSSNSKFSKQKKRGLVFDPIYVTVSIVSVFCWYFYTIYTRDSITLRDFST